MSVIELVLSGMVLVMAAEVVWQYFCHKRLYRETDALWFENRDLRRKNNELEHCNALWSDECADLDRKYWELHRLLDAPSDGIPDYAEYCESIRAEASQN